MPRIDTPITANAASLDRVLNNALPTLLVLHQGGLAPDLENGLKRIARNEVERLLVVKVDVAENPKLNGKYDLSRGAPLLVGLKNGQEVARRTQPTPDAVENFVAYLLGRKSQLDPAPAKPVHVTDASFVREVLHSEKPVLVDFWAEWCRPCHAIAPSLEKLAGEFAGRATIAKLNVDENPLTAHQFRIQGIPTLLLFKNGQVADKIVGAAPEPMLRQFIQKNL